jgi:hypothetical protein
LATNKPTGIPKAALLKLPPPGCVVDSKPRMKDHQGLPGSHNGKSDVDETGSLVNLDVIKKTRVLNGVLRCNAGCIRANQSTAYKLHIFYWIRKIIPMMIHLAFF